MESMKGAKNTLAEEVDKNGWIQKKISFKKFSAEHLFDFPEMTKQ